MNNAEKNIRELRENHLGRRKWSQTVLGSKLSILNNFPNGLRQKQIAFFETGYYREKNPKQFQEYLKAFAKFLSIHYTNIHYRKDKPISQEKEFENHKSEKIWITPQDLEQLGIEELLSKITTITADFSVDENSFSTNGDQTFSFSLRNHSSNYLAQEWNIDNESQSKDSHPTLHLPAGQHLVSLTVYDRHNKESASIAKKIKISGKGVAEVKSKRPSSSNVIPVVSFETADPENNPPRMVHFINNASPEFYHFEWSFGDGFVSHEKCPQHVFQKPGIYQVTLIARNQETSFTAAKPVLIPSADFNISRNGRWTSKSVQLVNNSRNALYYFWDYGDGSVSDDKSSDHHYRKYGTYDIKLKASSNDAIDEQMVRIKLADKLRGIIWFFLGAIVLSIMAYLIYQNNFKVYPEPRAIVNKIQYLDKKRIHVSVTRLTKSNDDQIYTLVVQRTDSTYRQVSWPKTENPMVFEDFQLGHRGSWSGVIFETPNPNDPFLDEYYLSVFCVNPADWGIIQEWYSYCQKNVDFLPMEVWFREHYIDKGRTEKFPLRPHNRIHQSLTELFASE